MILVCLKLSLNAFFKSFFALAQDWSELKIALACPLFISMIMFFFLPESPRWLLYNGRLDEAKKILERAIKVNGGTWPEGFELKIIEQGSKDKDQTGSTR